MIWRFIRCAVLLWAGALLWAQMDEISTLRQQQQFWMEVAYHENRSAMMSEARLMEMLVQQRQSHELQSRELHRIPREH